MPFLTIKPEMICSASAAVGFDVFFSPPPPLGDLPTVWLDLHLSDDYYQDCDDDETRRQLPVDRSGKKFLRIAPHKGVRLFTSEQVGLSCGHTALVVNVASRAKHGLIVAPGKVDPGFNPRRLVLVVYNQSDRPIVLHGGDKIACIAFAKLTEAANATKSVGHANGVFPDFEVRRLRKLRRWLLTRNYATGAYDIAKLIIVAGLALLGAWLTGRLK